MNKSITKIGNQNRSRDLICDDEEVFLVVYMPVIQNVHSTAVVTTLYFNHAKESHTTI
jgi:hypothetical protein